MIKINSISKTHVYNGAFIEGYLQRNYTFEKVSHGVVQTDISSAKKEGAKGIVSI